MTKSKLVTELASRKLMHHYKAEETVNEIFEAMTEALAEGGRIEVRGFGTFCLREYWLRQIPFQPPIGSVIVVTQRKKEYVIDRLV